MIPLEEFVDRLGRLGSDRGPRGFPRRARDRAILMKSIVLGLDAGRTYSEPQINAKLQAWSREVAPAIAVDHVTLRRLLVDHGHLERSADGAAYRVGFPARAVAFALDVYDLDPRAVSAAYREEQARRARARPRPPAAREPRS
jgi:hypothetical protein